VNTLDEDALALIAVFCKDKSANNEVSRGGAVEQRIAS